MNRSRLWVALLVLAGATISFPTQAFAEFTSLTKGHSSGKAVGATITQSAGGAKVICEEPSEAGNEGTWAIKKTEASEKGPKLQIKMPAWSKCAAETGSIKEKAELSECELELEQKGKETGVNGALANVCKIKIGLCEVTAEPKGNTQLKGVKLAYTGNEDKGLLVTPEVTNLNTKVNSSCSSVGVNATSEGKLMGTLEGESLEAAQNGPPEFAIETNRDEFDAITQAAEVKIKNVTAVQRTALVCVTSQMPGGSFVKIENEPACRMAIGAGLAVTVKVKYDTAPTPPPVFIYFSVQDNSGNMIGKQLVITR